MMHQLKQVNILDMMKMYGEDSCKEVLSTFMCPLNLDVEDFIHNKAIEFARQRIAVTFLVFKEAECGSALVGYYTLVNKFISIVGTNLPFSITGTDLLSMALQHKQNSIDENDVLVQMLK